MSTSQICRYLPTTPCRVPDWRWQLAQRSIRHPEDTWLAPHIDGQIRIAIASQKNTEAVSAESAAGIGPVDVKIAHQIHETRGWDRCLLESRILSGQPLHAAADHLALPVSVVTAYNQLFFDVLSRLQQRGFINHFTVQLPASYSKAIDLPTALRAFAYAGGPHVLGGCPDTGPGLVFVDVML